MLKGFLGKQGEDEAALFLRKQGYRIVARNVRTALGELDIVAHQHGVVCFVEVRTRRGKDSEVQALESVDERKQRRLSRLALAYLKENHLLGRKARFDVVSVSYVPTGRHIFLIKNAFDVCEKYN
jgi:putative endonuclease